MTFHSFVNNILFRISIRKVRRKPRQEKTFKNKLLQSFFELLDAKLFFILGNIIQGQIVLKHKDFKA